jgi:hypothetical protein
MTSLGRLYLSLGGAFDSVIEVVDSDDESLPKEKGQKRRLESEDEVDVVHGSGTTEERYSPYM